MDTTTLKNSFKTDVLTYLDSVTMKNFFEKYDPLVAIVYSYKDKGLSKNDVTEIVSQISNTELTDAQDEVLLEISNRLYGFCTSTRAIDW